MYDDLDDYYHDEDHDQECLGTELDYECGCNVCGDTEASTTDYYGSQMCDACIDIDRNGDIEGHEERKRERIAESCEY